MKSWLVLSSSIGLFGLAATANAQSAKSPIEVEVGGEYQFALFNTDDGLKADGKETEETDFAVRAAKIALRGKLSEAISWNVLYQLDKSALERYWLTNKVTDTLEVSIGQQKIKTYGWHRKLSSSSTSPIRSALLSVNPLTDKMAIDVVYKMFGTWSASFVKDYYDNNTTNCSSTTDNCKSWNGYEVQKQPALVLEWQGSFGEFQPLLQYARYDRNHSWTADAGIRFKNDVVDAYVDYTIDERNFKGVDTAGKAEDWENTYDGVTVYGEWFAAGGFTPYFFFSTFNYDEYTPAGTASVETNKDGSLDDNESTFAVGSFYDGYGKFYRPYLGVALSSGEYKDPDDATKKETRTKTDILLGLTGKF